MSTLTFYEILRTKITEFIPIKELFENLSNFKLISTSFDINWISKNILIGGWPSIYSKTINEKEEISIANDYVNNILNSKVEHINLNINKNVFNEILKSVARLNGSQINHSTILKDIKNQISLITLQKYIELLESLYLIDYLGSWSTNVRSKTTIRIKPKMYLCDPSIGLSVLKIKNNKYLIKDPRLFGLYFENQVIKDLKVFCQNIAAELYFYRDRNGFEIDAIIQLDDGKWAPIEIKLSNSNQDAINDSAKRLLSFENKIKTDVGIKTKPSFYMIIVGSNYSYKREDGVLVVPFTLLKP